jgi:hypothetical protein
VIGALLAHGHIQPTAPGVSGSSVRVLCGQHQALVFRETALPAPEHDGYHIQLTFSDFPAIHRRLADMRMRLITRGSVENGEYRFVLLISCMATTGACCSIMEHEEQHKLYGRCLVNSGAAATGLSFQTSALGGLKTA